eukprot:1142264-Pelagomonas_calceolata.AAC.3
MDPRQNAYERKTTYPPLMSRTTSSSLVQSFDGTQLDGFQAPPNLTILGPWHPGYIIMLNFTDAKTSTFQGHVTCKLLAMPLAQSITMLSMAAISSYSKCCTHKPC